MSNDGTLRGPERPVHTTTGVPFKRPTVAASLLGSVVSWAEEDPDQFDFVYGQRYWLGLFSDGFESGDTSNWSTTVP